jgi:formamidopyrimidine-DNA glycosylase
MPELPEVETIRRDLQSAVVGLEFTEVKFIWSGSLKGVPEAEFRRKVLGQKIVGVERRAKNLAIKLENHHSLLMHMKMTGHLLIEPDQYKLTASGNWETPSGTLADPLNQFIRVVFWLNNGKIMAFSDLRKFGYIKLVTDEELATFWTSYGPEPFSKEFSLSYLTNLFAAKKQAIKKVLMDQTNIAGIGNIYADEILWKTKIHPLTPANKLTPSQIVAIRETTENTLQRAIDLRGTSSSDYRDTKGEKGKFERELKVYRRTGQECSRCHGSIERIVIGARGTHLCPDCQILESS